MERCRACRLAFAVPRPTPQALEDFYGASYFEADTEFGYGDYEGGSWAAVNAARTWRELPDWAPEIDGVVPRRLLDVGAATGEFAVRAANDGWSAVACEVGETARALAAKKGLETVATIDEAEGPFGLISMFHVLEHLIDPVEGLRSCRSVVAQSGLLVIEVPHWRSLGRIVRGSRWAQFKPPEHINFFDRRSLAAALDRSGWSTVRISTPYPRSAELAIAAARRGAAREAVDQAARFVAGAAGVGGYLRAVARPA